MQIAVLLLHLTAYGILSVYLVVDAAHSFHCLSHMFCAHFLLLFEKEEKVIRWKCQKNGGVCRTKLCAQNFLNGFENLSYLKHASDWK